MSAQARNDGQTVEQTQPEAAPWTIKSVPVETRRRAVNAAAARDMTMAVWITEAVNLLADRQGRDGIIPPGKPEANPVVLPAIDLPGLAAAMNAATAAALAAGGKPPKALGREATAMLRRYMRAASGLPERQTKRQTISGNGQTLIGAPIGEAPIDG